VPFKDVSGIDGDFPKYEVGEEVLAAFKGHPYKGKIAFTGGIIN
jgi:hypothetical protein